MSLAGRACYALYCALAGAIVPFAARKDAARLAAQNVASDRIGERRGRATRPRPDGRVIWLHAVSVGEAMSVLPLAHHLSRHASVVLTTTSATSAAMVGQRAPELIHQFAPLDSGTAIRAFLDHWRPDLLVLTESELWPRQIVEAHARAIPVALVGARLSDRSLRRWTKLRPLAAHMLNRLSRVLAQDARTADGLRNLGLDPAKLTLVGSLKSAARPLPVDAALAAQMRTTLAGRPVWVAASTHPGEEDIAADAHRSLRSDVPDLVLILAPRHPDRGDAIAADLARAGWNVAQRSKGQLPDASTQIYVADTLGELGTWFELSPVAFIGGSFAGKGGHNPLEAAQLGCHAVTGPSITNFADLYADLMASGAAHRIDAPNALVGAIDRLRTEPPPNIGAQDGPDPAQMATDLLVLTETPPPDSPPRVIAPNFKRRLSGVTATVVRLVPLQAQKIAIRATAPALPPHVPQIPLWQLPFLPARVPRVWHARRNVEMIGGLALKHLLRKRLMLLFTSASQRQHTAVTKWLIGRMDAVVATSARTARYLDRPATVIRHGIDTDTFRPATDRAELRKTLGLPGGILVGCYGRIRPSKGTDLFVRAMIDTLPRFPNATALVMGRATDRDRAFETDLKRAVERADLSDRIRFLPEVPVHDIADFYAALDIYVAPQRWEGFGLTPLEAMAAGVPVIATRVGAFEELIVDGETGHLIAPDDPAAMASAIDTALRDTATLATKGKTARAHVSENFTLQSESDALIAVYRALLARP